MRELTLLEAVNAALSRAMEEDPEVVLLGEDIGRNGGVFRATLGLQACFGTERVMDTPLAESVIAGMAIGMAAQGLHPVAEIQFAGFAYPAFDQIINHMGRLRHRTRGRLTCPMVVRMPVGGGIHAPEHHSESPEAYFVHTPGLKVVIPSSPSRAYGLLLAAIRDPDPVMFLEPTRLYRLLKEPVDEQAPPLSLGQAFVLREGQDLTLLTWGAAVHEVGQVAEALAAQGISAEVVDLACLSPLDWATVLASVEKTGRCVIVHEAPRTCGVGAEVAAVIAERALLSLQAPIERVTGFDTPMPLARAEMCYIPSVARILAACERVLAY